MAVTNLFKSHARAPVAFVRGEGMQLFSEDGKAYLDFVAGIAVDSVGHAHPALTAALHHQIDQYIHVSNLFHVPEQERLAERLCAMSFGDRVFFCNSGAEANEAAIKTSRWCHHANGNPERTEIITFQGAFHGRTYGALAATGNKSYMTGFGPMPDGFVQIPPNDLSALRSTVSHSTAAVMMEPLQAEGGLRAFDLSFVKEVRDLCDEMGAHLIFDEVQTGIARTGHMFGYQALGVTPDLMTLAKGLGGGVPIGAVVATAAVEAPFKPGLHGSTFGGNPLAMAAGNAVLDIVSAPGFLERVRNVSAYLRERCEQVQAQFPTVFYDVRGMGLLFGMACQPPVGELIDAMRERGVLVHRAGENVLRLLPPLIVERSHVDTMIDALSDVAQQYS